MRGTPAPGWVNAELKHVGSSPRMRGTLVPAIASSGPAKIDGSSPRMRGTPDPHRLQPVQDTSDHPRACGELWSSDSLKLADTGSSPRMRGTRRRRSPPLSAARIIPAHAGNSTQVAAHQNAAMCVGSSPRMRGTLEQRDHRRTDAVSDHPRACGELILQRSPVLSAIAVGSSPRMRGTRREPKSAPFSSFGSSPRMRGTRCRGMFQVNA